MFLKDSEEKSFPPPPLFLRLEKLENPKLKFLWLFSSTSADSSNLVRQNVPFRALVDRQP